MAKQKKPEEQAPGSPAWMATFSDLMNLLLCFFVLLFSMSSVDEAKWEDLVNSMANRISIFPSGSSSIGEGQLISTGMSQLNDLDNYFNTMGKAGDDSGDDPMSDLQKAVEEMNKEETTEMYDDISSMSSEYNLDDDIDIGVDMAGNRYITIEINGDFLYASGNANLASGAIPIFSRIGDILKNYEGYRIAIIGHTDNVPVTSGRYASNMELSSARASNAAKYLIENKGIDPASLEWVGKGEYEPIADNSTEAGRRQNRRIEIRIYNSLNSN